MLITSPYTWMTDFTDKRNWLGGFEREGQRVKTIDTLKDILKDEFNLLQCSDLPFLIKEHTRKYQWSVAQGSLWLRK